TRTPHQFVSVIYLWLSEHALRAFLPISSAGSHLGTSPNFCLWFNVFSQHDVRELLRRNGA
ncbi:hypothetical protein, partial [Aeromonas rivipollensis]|uniref:hypothetical protein n=1 Tax=Aeromonas rivipollensis TaxID=948519 RepID=UPI001F43A381